MAWRRAEHDSRAVWVIVAALAGAAVIGTIVLGLGGGFGAAGPGSSLAMSPGTSSASPVADPYASRYPIVRHSVAVIGDDTDDVFLPLAASAGLPVRRLPVAVVLPDRRVDPSQYEQFAHDVASYGLVVVVASRSGRGVLASVDTWSRRVDADSSAPAEGLVEPGSLVVVVHGDAASGPPPNPWPRSVAATAVVLPTGSPWAGRWSGPLLVLAGGAGTDRPAAHAAFAAARGAPRALVAMAAVDQLAVTDQGRGTPRTVGDPTPRRAARLDVVAQYTAWWLLAHLGSPTGRAFYAATPPAGVHLTRAG